VPNPTTILQRGLSARQIVGSLIVGLIVVASLTSKHSDEQRSASRPDAAPAQAVASTAPPASSSKSTAETKKADPEEKKEDSILFVAAIGAKQLKQAMRDPDSFRLESVTVVDASKAICYDYRSRNGFGGMNVGHAAWSGDRKKFLTSEQSGFAALWNRECANKSGTERLRAVEILM
jgi:hypothetical protein